LSFWQFPVSEVGDPVNAHRSDDASSDMGLRAPIVRGKCRDKSWGRQSIALDIRRRGAAGVQFPTTPRARHGRCQEQRHEGKAGRGSAKREPPGARTAKVKSSNQPYGKSTSPTA
jgi:hypothetical protein